MTMVQVEHVKLEGRRDFDEVIAALEAAVPHVKSQLSQMLVDGDAEAIAQERREGPPLWIFARRDHGALLSAEGRARKAWQYEIGNPLTAESMTRHVMGAGLYAPLRVLFYESDDGGTVVEYDLPSSQFGQFGNDAVARVGLMLDTEIAAALARALDGPL